MATPTIVFGVGETGLEALESLALYLPQTYDSQLRVSIPLIGFGWADMREPRQATINWYTIQEDVRDLLKDRADLENRPDIVSWFDLDYYAQNIFVTQPIDYTARQLARLHFLYFAQQNLQILTHQLRSQVKRLAEIPDLYDTASVQVHLLANLDDTLTVSALLDIIMLIYQVIHLEGRSSRIILHLALPKSASMPLESINEEQNTILPNAYALVQELKRFAVSYGLAQNHIYHEDSSLAIWNVTDAKPLNSVNVYHQAHPTPIAQRWVDILLPLLDSKSDHLGGIYAHNLMNWSNVREQVLAERSERYTLVISSYETYSAIFPLWQLREYWAGQLAVDALVEWVGETVTLTQATRIFNYYWQKDNLSVNLIPPKIISTLLSGSLPIDGNMAGHLLDAFMPRDDTYAVSWRRTHRDKLGWDYTQVDTSSDAESYIRDMRNDLQYLFGNMDGHDVEAMYSNTLAQYSEGLFENFQLSLTALVHILLARETVTPTSSLEHHGLSVLNIIIDEVMLSPLRHVQQQFQRELLNVQQRISNANFKSQYDTYAANIFKLFNWRGQWTSDTDTFNALVQQATALLKAYTITYTVSLFLDRCILHLENVSDQVNTWQSILVDEQTGLIPLLRREAPTFEPDQSPTRLWLFDEAWIVAQYERLRAKQGEKPTDLQWQYHQNTLRLMAAGNDGITFSAQDGIQTRLHEFWIRVTYNYVHAFQTDMWNDYLALDNRFTHHTDELIDVLKTQDKHWSLQAHAHQDFLLFPTNMSTEDEMQAIVRNLQSTQEIGAFETLRSVASNRIVRWTSHEGFLIEDLPEYHVMRRAYEQVPYTRRRRLHVLGPESEALRLQNKAQEWFGMSLRFSGDLIVLLTNIERLQMFLNLQAFGFIHEMTIAERAEVNRYLTGIVLEQPLPTLKTYPDELWWLQHHSNTQSGEIDTLFEHLYKAIEGFVFGAPVLHSQHLQKNQTLLFSEQKQTIPYEEFQGWIVAAVDTQLTLLGDTPHFEDASLNRAVLNILRHQGQNDGEWAKRVGVHTEVLQSLLKRYDAYLQASALSQMQSDNKPFVELVQLVVILLNEMIFDNKQRLQSRLL